MSPWLRRHAWGIHQNVCCISNKKKKESASLKRASARRYSAFVSVAIVPFLFPHVTMRSNSVNSVRGKKEDTCYLKNSFFSLTNAARADVILRVSVVRSIGLSVGSNHSLEKGLHYFSIPLGVHSNQTLKKKIRLLHSQVELNRRSDVKSELTCCM